MTLGDREAGGLADWTAPSVSDGIGRVACIAREVTQPFQTLHETWGAVYTHSLPDLSHSLYSSNATRSGRLLLPAHRPQMQSHLSRSRKPGKRGREGGTEMILYSWPSINLLKCYQSGFLRVLYAI